MLVKLSASIIIRRGICLPKINNLGHGSANHATEGKCFSPPSAAVT